MKLETLHLTNFQCFGSDRQSISFAESITMVIGPNGSGKTAVLQALSRLFDANPSRRRIRREDFNVPFNEESRPQERKLIIEADFLVSKNNTELEGSYIPACFNHMRLDEDGETIRIRFKLEATMGTEDDIEESLYYVLGREQDGKEKLKRVPRAERNHISVYYLPAKRDPLDQIRSGTTSLLGRIVRSVNWESEETQFQSATSELQTLVTGNSAIGAINSTMTKAWSELHKGTHFKNANVVFGLENLDKLIENLSVEFNPAHALQTVDYSLLSDGQKSLLYLSLVVTFIETGRETMLQSANGNTEIQLDKLNPPVFSLIAIEEPENSLSPHYLGRINKLLKTATSSNDAQAIVTTHSPSMLRRIDPKQIRYTRMNESRTTTVREIQLPPSAENDAYKFIREGLLSNPEVYFARVVVLGEGASEDIVLPKLFESIGLPMDENGIVVAQLGGRHVNYMWRLLTDLGIPHATLLDLDLGRHQGGWGRFRYAAKQLNDIGASTENIDAYKKWNESNPTEGPIDSSHKLFFFAQHGVFFSRPLDLDFSMISSFPKAYQLDASIKSTPDAATIKSVLGKSNAGISWFTKEQQELFDAYHSLFKLGSKPAAHLEAFSNLTAEEIAAALPNPYKGLANHIKKLLTRAHE